MIVRNVLKDNFYINFIIIAHQLALIKLINAKFTVTQMFVLNVKIIIIMILLIKNV